MRVIYRQQLSEMLRISDRTLDHWVANGTIIPPKRPTARTIFWDLSDIEAWMASLPTDMPASRPDAFLPGGDSLPGIGGLPGPGGITEL